MIKWIVSFFVGLFIYCGIYHIVAWLFDKNQKIAKSVISVAIAILFIALIVNL